jgi:allantoinase
MAEAARRIGSAGRWSIRSTRVVLDGAVRPATIDIADGMIAAVRDHDAATAGPRYDAGDALVLPGLVDTHVHINEPGRTEWEGFATATRAAAAGGVTTLIEMPLNAVPPTTTVEGLRSKVASAAGKLSVDVGFWGGVVPGNAAQLEPLWNAGVLGFKCFMVPSGVAEFGSVTETDLREAMPILARLGAPLLAHAEVPGPIEQAAELQTCVGWDARRYSCYLESRPRAAELEAIALLIRLMREYGTRVHIVHLSAADAVPMLREARAAGLPLTVETCPHYLHFAAEQIGEGATAFKCAPPIRESENREALWAALAEGVIDLVVTDHSPCPPELKLPEEGDFLRAWGGIASLQLGAAAVWSGMWRRGLPVERLAQWMCAAPARLAGVDWRKGAIAAGLDADLVVLEPDGDYLVTPNMLHHRHHVTPYSGERLAGVVKTTILRGTVVFDGGELIGDPMGRVLTRTTV